MKKNGLLNGFTLLVFVLCLLTFSLNMYNGRFHLGDFKVYYSAASNFFHGGPVYLVSFYTGSGNYKYSPATLFFFLPYLLFNFKTAAIIHFFILGAAYWYTFQIIRRVVGDYFFPGKVMHEIRLISIVFICILIHFARELYLGNVNILLLLLCCLAIRSLLASRQMPGGILLGIVILTKPYLLILLLPLILRKKWPAIGWLFLTVAAGLMLPFVFPGPKQSLGMYLDWIKSIRAHGADFPGMTSLDYIVRLLFPSWPSWGVAVIFLVVCMAVTLFILNNIHREKQPGAPAGIENMTFAYEWFLLAALLPNLIRTDWVLLLFSAPLIAFMVFYTASRKKYVWIPILIVLIFFYGANSDDLLGRSLSHAFLTWGLMGLSNFLLVTASFIMFLDHRKRMRTP